MRGDDLGRQRARLKIHVIKDLLRRIRLQGLVVTDALLTQRALAKVIVDRGDAASCRSRATIPRCGGNCISPSSKHKAARPPSHTPWRRTGIV